MESGCEISKGSKGEHPVKREEAAAGECSVG